MTSATVRQYRRFSRAAGKGVPQDGSCVVSFRMTPDQARLLEDAAEAEGVTTSEVIRRRVFGPLPPVKLIS